MVFSPITSCCNRESDELVVVGTLSSLTPSSVTGAEVVTTFLTFLLSFLFLKRGGRGGRERMSVMWLMCFRMAGGSGGFFLEDDEVGSR